MIKVKQHYYLTDKELPKTHYTVLSLWISENHNEVPILGVKPIAEVEVSLGDCYLDEEGNFFAPKYYNWSYKGSDELTDPDEYTPVYDSSTPTLTKIEVANMVALEEFPEMNDKARNISEEETFKNHD